MKQANQIKIVDLVETVVIKALKAFVCALIAVLISYIVAALYIGMREMPKHYDHAVNQYMEYQAIKDKNSLSSQNE